MFNYDMGSSFHYDTQGVNKDGGAGSGNWGHVGRKGARGGSAKGSGGKAHRTGTKETGFSSEAKERAKKKAEAKGVGGSSGKSSSKSVSRDLEDMTQGEKTKVSKIQKDMKCSETQAIQYHDAIATLTDPTRASELGIEMSSKDVKKSLENYIDNSPRWNGTILHRGANLSDEEVSNLRAIMKNEGKASVQGKTFDDLGVTSWSTDRSVVRQYQEGNGQRVRFMLYGATQAADISKYSLLQGEREVITKNSAKFEVTNFYKNDNGELVITLFED